MDETTGKLPCRISILGTQSLGKDKDSTGNVYHGTIADRGRKQYIQYTEENVNFLIVSGDDTVEVVRSGAASSKMVYKSGERTTTLYETGYGTLNMDINTQLVKIVRMPNVTIIRLEYELYVGSGEPLKNVLEMKVEWSGQKSL